MEKAERHALVSEARLDALEACVRRLVDASKRVHILKDNPRRPHGHGYFVPLRQMQALRALLERLRSYDEEL